MRILICNDDGINSEGIIALALMLYKKGHEITVVAPEGNRSSYSHHVNFYTEIKMHKVDFAEGIEAYTLSGTPADCSLFGLHGLGKKFDIVCSGINVGSNLGSEVIYSGTVAACEEATMAGIKSIAFSYCGHGASKANYTTIAEICGKIFDKFAENLDGDYVLNVNIPSETANADEVKVTPLGVRLYSDEHRWKDEETYILTGSPLEIDNAEDCDVVWAAKGYITATPVSIERTADAAVAKLTKKL